MKQQNTTGKPWWLGNIDGLKVMRVNNGRTGLQIKKGDVVTAKQTRYDDGNNSMPHLYIKENKLMYLPVNFEPLKTINQ